MGQVNINYDDATLKGIDRVAGIRGLSRSDLLRAIAHEAVEAHEAGRLAFQMEDDAPRIETSLNALALQLREGVVEQERSQRALQRLEKKMLDAWVSNDEAIRLAEQSLMTRISDINRKSYEPFVMKMREVHGAIEDLKTYLAEVESAGHKVIAERLEAVRVQARVPRNLYRIVLGEEVSPRLLALAALLVSALATLSFLLLANNIAWLGVPVAKRLLPTPELICRVINEDFGVRDCLIPIQYRKGASIGDDVSDDTPRGAASSRANLNPSGPGRSSPSRSSPDRATPSGKGRTAK